MKIILAPDSFKESLSAWQVCEAMEVGIRRCLSDAEIVRIPLADGGEGTVRTLVNATNGTLRIAQVTGPLGEPVQAEYGLFDDGRTAVLEMASASGLHLVPADQRNPYDTTTYGTGELLLQAVEQGCEKIVIGIGGSATNDGGSGMAQALGVKFLRRDGTLITDFMTNAKLKEVADIDTSGMPDKLLHTDILVACDVDNPLLGDAGATYIYSRQKGAQPQDLENLELNMRTFYDLAERRLNRIVRHQPGAGAAGGLGAALLMFTNARLTSGIETMLQACRFNEQAKDADLILTGEGKIDAQSAQGKTIRGVITKAVEHSIPVIAIGGSVDGSARPLIDLGLTAMFSICNQPLSLQQALENAPSLIADCTEQIMRVAAGS